jgi:hypothetical protein
MRRSRQATGALIWGYASSVQRGSSAATACNLSPRRRAKKQEGQDGAQGVTLAPWLWSVTSEFSTWALRLCLVVASLRNRHSHIPIAAHPEFSGLGVSHREPDALICDLLVARRVSRSDVVDDRLGVGCHAATVISCRRQPSMRGAEGETNTVRPPRRVGPTKESD